jgi:sulfur-oxidizing protein SoxX
VKERAKELLFAGAVLIGDPVSGEALYKSREATCTLCHASSLRGDIGPNLSGIGSRLSPDEIRVRIASARSLDPAGPMPSYGQTEGLINVAPAFDGRPILTPQQIEDLVAYLSTLRAP